MKKITVEEVKQLADEAASVPCLRKILNYHTDYSDTLQSMLNAMQPGSYVQPHRHKDPDKREAFVILSGKIAVLEFDDFGHIPDQVILQPQEREFGKEIAAGVWKKLVVIDPDSVIFEVKDVPYSPGDDKNFAPWAPPEGNEKCADYLNELISKPDL